MSVESIFNMNGTSDEYSYANCSSYQQVAREMVDHITTKVIADFYHKERPNVLKIADLGCSTGPNSLSLIGKIYNEIDKSCNKARIQVPEIQVFLNDLPTNDFNSIFTTISNYIRSISNDETRDGISSVFVVGVAGSFYGRIFPRNSLHFVHSSYCLNWLSQIPTELFDENGKPKEKGRVYISKQSSELVLRAYHIQFQKDFSLFLKSRSIELVSGGKLVLTFIGRRTNDLSDKGATFIWNVLDETFKVLVAKGEIDEEKVNAYKTHCYNPSMLEVRAEVEREGSFFIEKFEIYTRSFDDMNGFEVAKLVRNLQESLLVHHFNDGVNLKRLFELYAELADKKLPTITPPVSFTIVLQKIV